MGSVQGKNKTNTVDNTPTTPIPKGNGVSPLYAIAASLNQGLFDPRSPGSKRTPLSTPFESPCTTPTLNRVKHITRLGSSSKFGTADPRSPASKRTPLRKAEVPQEVQITPPPFSLSLGDPRSPLTFQTRTPLTDSVQEAIVVHEDIVLATEEEVEEKGEVVGDLEILVKQEIKDQDQEQTSTASESTSERVITEVFNSPDYSPSPTVMALTMSPMNSPLGSRKRKDHIIKGSHSPLKKSYSAPIDENAPPSSPINKPLRNRARTRTPLSPISQRTIKSNNMAVQPIKLRMDTSILG